MSMPAKQDARPAPGTPVSVNPDGWPRPKGYSNGMLARGAYLVTGGLVGWDQDGAFPDGLVPQTRQTLKNVVAVLEAGGARPEHVVRMTWYVTDMEAYRRSLSALAPVYRDIMGKHFPAMAVVQVVTLVEPQALVEIEATAVIPDAG